MFYSLDEFNSLRNSNEHARGNVRELQISHYYQRGNCHHARAHLKKEDVIIADVTGTACKSIIWWQSTAVLTKRVDEIFLRAKITITTMQNILSQLVISKAPRQIKTIWMFILKTREQKKYSTTINWPRLTNRPRQWFCKALWTTFFLS